MARRSKSSLDYWLKREKENLRSNLKKEAEFFQELEEIYNHSLDDIQKEINAFYSKYAASEGISISEAKKRASKLDMDEYERKAKKYVKEKNFSKQANDEMRLYNMTMKVNRLELLKANIGLELVSCFDELDKKCDKMLTERTQEEFERQAGLLGASIINNAFDVQSIVNASFHNATFSERIWSNQELLKNDISKLLQTGLIQGKNPRELARELRKDFSSSKFNSERLMRTELARVQTEAQRRTYEREGFDQYTYITAEDGKVCDICRDLNGKHFDLKDMQVGENAPPMHPCCRCSTSAYMDDESYNKWLDSYKEHGLDHDAWKENGIINPIPNNKSQELTNRRKERLAARKSASEVKNKYGQTITFDKSLDGEGWKRSINLIKQLANEYNTRLLSVGVGAHRAAGTVNFGGEMRLSSKKAHTAIHEFAHSISIESLTKFGVEQHEEFWKEIKKIKRQYRKDVGDNSTRWISSYEHSNGSADEFLAEAFTHAKLKQLGLEIPSGYGVDFAYSDKVLAVVDKYFKKASGNDLKEIANSGGSSTIKPTKVINGHKNTPKFAKPHDIIDHVLDDGTVDSRGFFGDDGVKEKDIHTTNHGNPKMHPYGQHGEHGHDYEWDEEGRLKSKTARELTEEERKDNGDIL